ncbi:hypothetical protein LZQ00_10075 [Sphingobacterium sp. SRCM116780]|uniref:hypothetical protein n=1 Tax=Sphingobacterium sp. SRCM116780 TaxID=2907623 RepID=UPI001F31E898|nr:hypothetical protein [Sphingobacterium sp. SRCM116780]UIR54621.1 hypothetical protein LZQ00_10075 [Sphingobacterium sp. SRCM116780]
MIKWKEIDYKKRNQLLYVGAILMLVLGWWLAFGKTYEAYRLNKQLSAQVGSDVSHSAQYQLEHKSKILDSLTKVYQTDSTNWDDNFLSNASRAVNSPTIQVYYNNNPLKNRLVQIDSSATRNKLLTIKGDYRAIVQSIAELEKITTLGYLSTINLKMDNKKNYSEQRKVIEGEVGFTTFIGINRSLK